MPFIACLGDTIVVPADIPDGEAVTCVECEEALYPRDGEGFARHFFHAAENADEYCSKARGESETHERCTALAVGALLERFDTDLARYGVEERIDVPNTQTHPDYRRADALVEFEAPHERLGNGLIVEVQHRHHTKDVEGVSYDYIQAGYSVIWIEPSDFETERLDPSAIDARLNSEQHGFAANESRPWDFEACIENRMRWDDPGHRGGEHEWAQIPAYAHPDDYNYEYCTCGARRRYDRENARYVYDHDGVLKPTVPTVSVALPGKNGEASTTEVDREQALVENTAVAPCRGPQMVHEWEGKVNHRETTEWSCRYCPVRLVQTVDDVYRMIGDPEENLQFTFSEEIEKRDTHYCLSCDQYTTVTKTGECANCSSLTLTQPRLPTFPDTWTPHVNADGLFHRYLDLQIALTERKDPVEYGISVTWPNHLPRHTVSLDRDIPVNSEREAFVWMYGLLEQVDAEYSPGSIMVIADIFGGTVEEATKDEPVVETDLSCETCGAYLPHYKGNGLSAWYKNHYEYVDDDDHPEPEDPSVLGSYDEFAGTCPHCEFTTSDPHSAIDHLQEHGYSRDEAYSIRGRIADYGI